MKVGDVVINPYVKSHFKDGELNNKYRSMVVRIGKTYTDTLTYDGKIVNYYTHDIKTWEIVDNVNLYETIYGTSEVDSKDIGR